MCVRAYLVQLERSSSFIRIKWIKHALAHSFEVHIRANFYSSPWRIWRVHIPFMKAKITVLGLIMSFPPYLRSVIIRFPFTCSVMQFDLELFSIQDKAYIMQPWLQIAPNDSSWLKWLQITTNGCKWLKTASKRF